MHLHEALNQRVVAWRDQHYALEDDDASFDAITEILEWARQPIGSGFRLREPQIQALETYWYLRLVAGTPAVPDLYTQLYSGDPAGHLKALGVPGHVYEPLVEVLGDGAVDAILNKVRQDDAYVKQHKLQALRETLTLDYPSYILALAMGAGKTMLIGAIFATEFAMSMEYPDGPFVQNALVFAPGKTIIESLRELAETPYDRILPPRFYKDFAASIKLTFTRDGDPDISVIPGSIFNVVVTNTEKIRIQKETIRKKDIGSLLPGAEDEARSEVANRRLLKIASLPHLGIFSDEAHHTYGQSLDTGLKKVRKTVDYLAAATNLICIVNTTGTPYFRRQLLKDVVVWYGLSQGIADNILKEVANNIFAFTYDDAATAELVAHVVEDFFKAYGNVSLPNGAPARLAIYFPQTDDLAELRPVVEQTLIRLGLSPDLVLVNTSKSSQAEIDAFNRLNDPKAPHRVILLVNKGTEGWNCPSLFACALVRKLIGRNNFVLQAASRCLRQIPGNDTAARIYLSAQNRNILDKQLQESYGESLADLNKQASRRRTARITLRKLDIPPLLVRRIIRTVVPRHQSTTDIVLIPPQAQADATLQITPYTLAEQRSTDSVLKQIGETVTIKTTPQSVSLYNAAVELAAVYRTDLWALLAELRRLYPAGDLPISHLSPLAQQLEAQVANYEVQEETVEQALALVKPDGFTAETADDGTEIWTAEISYPIDREHLLLSLASLLSPGDFGFHYDPYNFDSVPEKNFFEQILTHLNQHPDDIEDIFFTGALTTPDKTEFLVDYLDADGVWRNYTPDFIIRRKDDRCLIIEVKSAQYQAATLEDLSRHTNGQAAITVEGRKAVALKRWQDLNPDRLKYQLVFAPDQVIGFEQLQPVKDFVENEV